MFIAYNIIECISVVLSDNHRDICFSQFRGKYTCYFNIIAHKIKGNLLIKKIFFYHFENTHSWKIGYLLEEQKRHEEKS